MLNIRIFRDDYAYIFMKRKDAAEAIGRALADFFTTQGLTQAQVAECYDVSQSWVGRIYKGEFGIRAESVQRMCSDAGIPFLTRQSTHDQLNESKRLRLTRLLDSIWEGTEEDAKALTVALQAIKSLRRS
ncbi:hypothetical protein PPUTLS46_001797 [Pseudomonas putida LS46]|nr:hypothetical protein PPUTLS46_001797 [Pseudomonas putida LS46]